jgi:hypothetical protein
MNGASQPHNCYSGVEMELCGSFVHRLLRRSGSHNDQFRAFADRLAPVRMSPDVLFCPLSLPV